MPLLNFVDFQNARFNPKFSALKAFAEILANSALELRVQALFRDHYIGVVRMGHALNQGTEFKVSLIWHPRSHADQAHRWLRGLIVGIATGEYWISVFTLAKTATRLYDKSLTIGRISQFYRAFSLFSAGTHLE